MQQDSACIVKAYNMKDIKMRYICLQDSVLNLGLQALNIDSDMKKAGNGISVTGLSFLYKKKIAANVGLDAYIFALQIFLGRTDISGK